MYYFIKYEYLVVGINKEWKAPLFLNNSKICKDMTNEDKHINFENQIILDFVIMPNKIKSSLKTHGWAEKTNETYES